MFRIRGIEKVLLAISICTFVIGCHNSARRAENLLSDAKASISEAQSRADSSPEEALDLFRLGLYKLEQLQEQYSGTEAGARFVRGEENFGGKNLTELRSELIPQLEKRVLARQHPLGAAEYILSQQPASHEKLKLLQRCARAHDAAGEKKEAIELLRLAAQTAEQPGDEKARILRLLDLAIDYFDLGLRNEALEIAFRALSLARQLPDGEANQETLLRTAEVYFRLGVEQRGLEAIRSIPDRRRRHAALVELGRNLIASNLHQHVLAAAEMFFDPLEKSRYLLDMAEVTSAQALAQPTLVFLDNAERLLDLISGKEDSVKLMISLSRLYRKNGHAARSKNLMRRVAQLLAVSSQADVRTLARAAGEFAAVEMPDETLRICDIALPLAKKVSDPDVREVLVVSLGVSLSRAGFSEKAEKVLKGVSDPFFNNLARIGIGGNLFAAGRKDEAQKIFEQVENYLKGDLSGAEYERVFDALQEKYVELGEYDEVLTLAMRLRDRDQAWKKRLRTGALKVLEAGQSEIVITVARGLDDAYMQAILLIEAARSIARTENSPQVAAIIGEAVTISQAGESPERKEAMREYLADLLLQMKWPQEVEALALKYGMPNMAYWFARMAASYAELGEADAALRCLAMLESTNLSELSPMDQAKLLVEMGLAYARLQVKPSAGIKQWLAKNFR